jgi:predicted nucleotidyltransferase
MIPELDRHRDAIAELCRRFGIRRLDVVGSAARGADFDPARSDVDFLVEYAPGTVPSLGEFLALRDALAALLGRPVDLVMASGLRNPFVRAELERSRAPLYAM